MQETEIIARVKNKSGSGSRSQLSLTSSIIAENPHKSNRFEENRGTGQAGSEAAEETVGIDLKSADAASGATPIAFAE